MKNNYNVHYNINNSFNINQIQKNNIFDKNQLSITNSISFKINKSYENLNIISKGNFLKDSAFQKKIKLMIIKKYDNQNIPKIVVTQPKNNDKNNNNIKHTYLRRNSKLLPFMQEIEGKKENKLRLVRRNSDEPRKSMDINDEGLFKKKDKKEGSNKILNRITQNIIDGDKNLNNPERFYNELFNSIINKKTSNIKSKKTTKKKSVDSKKIFRRKKSSVFSGINFNSSIK